jgi:hypothetical protein
MENGRSSRPEILYCADSVVTKEGLIRNSVGTETSFAKRSRRRRHPNDYISFQFLQRQLSLRKTQREMFPSHTETGSAILLIEYIQNDGFSVLVTTSSLLVPKLIHDIATPS